MMDGGLKEDGSGVRSRAGGASTARALGAVPVVAFFIIHFLGWGVDLGAFTYEFIKGPGRARLRKFGWVMTYLTIWNQFSQGLYFLFAFVVDFMLRKDSKAGWGWLHRSDSNSFDVEDHNLAERTKKWLRHRDRFFTLVWVTGNMVGIGYWLLLFPHASVRAHALSSTGGFIQDLIMHAFTTIMINVEMFTVRHWYRYWPLELFIVCIYGLGYLGWNILVHADTGAWAYPSIQSGHSLGVDIGMYCGLFCLFVLLYWIGRVISSCYWRCLDNRARARQREDSDAIGEYGQRFITQSGGVEILA